MTDSVALLTFSSFVSKAQRLVACNRGAILQGMG